MNEKMELMKVVATAGFTIEGIGLGLLGVLFSVYAVFAPGDEQGVRLPIVARLRVTAYMVAGFVVLTAITTSLSVWWLLAENDLLFNVTLSMFLLETIVVIPFIALMVVRRFN